MEVVTGHKDGTNVYVDDLGYLYFKNKQNGDSLYLRCATPNCKGTAVNRSDGYLILVPHNVHEKPRDKIVVLRFRERLRLDVKLNPEKPPNTIYLEAARLNPEAARLVCFKDVKSMLVNTRAQMCPPIPRNLEDLASYLDIAK